MTVGNLRSLTPPVVYRPPLQAGAFGSYPTIQITTTGDPALISDTVRRTVRDLARESAHETITLEERLRRSASADRLGAAVAVAVAVLAALLVFIGLGRLLASAVSRHAREIGIRVAVGASPAAIRRLVVKESVVLTAIGVALGILAAVCIGRAMRSSLFGIIASDPLTLAAASAFVLALGFTAGAIPAPRAANVDQAMTLRAEYNDV